MKKIISIIAFLFLYFVSFSQCHIYDTANVITQNIGGNIDSISLQSKFYVVENGSPFFATNQLTIFRIIQYKVPSNYTGIQMILYSDSMVNRWVKINYPSW